jgi:hypothetical protein
MRNARQFQHHLLAMLVGLLASVSRGNGAHDMQKETL